MKSVIKTAIYKRYKRKLWRWDRMNQCDSRVFRPSHKYVHKKWSVYYFGNKNHFRTSEHDVGDVNTFNQWTDRFVKKHLFKYDYFDDEKHQKKIRPLRDLQMFIIKKDIPYIIMKYHNNIENFIKKNNTFIKMGNEVCLNLTPDQVETIKSRWGGAILRDKKIKVDKMGITPIDLMIELLRCAGNLSEVARRLSMSRFEIKTLIEKNETLYRIYLEIEEIYLDYVEWKLKELVDTGDRNAIQYFLNNRGNVRGYGSYESRRRVSKSIRGEEMKSQDFELG